MSTVITGPGLYLTDDKNTTAEVFAKRGGWWYGIIKPKETLYPVAAVWRDNGQHRYTSDRGYSIIGPKPTPPEGFELADRETYKAKMGKDKTYSHYGWDDVFGHAGYTAVELDERYPKEAPHFFATPTKPKEPPFRISDKGCGVYETRDGREAIVSGKREQAYCWHGTVDGSDRSWTDSGSFSTEPRRTDLVRYLRPLPKWTPTNELRWKKCGPYDVGAVEMVKVSKAQWERALLEQRFTCGDKSEWRAVPVGG